MQKGRKTKEQMVLEYMETKGRISTWKATIELHETRLAAKIHDLKSKGIPIRDEMVYKTDENGYQTHWKEYWLAPEYWAV